MKKYLFAAIFAAVFTVPAFSQLTEGAEEDSVVIVVDENYVPEVIESERAEIQDLLAGASASTIVYDDNCGSVIYKTDYGKYGFINIRTSKKILFENQDFIELTDITGCGLAEGIITKKGNRIAAFSTKGDLLIPEIDADGVVQIMRNPFKTTSTNTWGYAIVKRGDDLYAVNTAGNMHMLEMDKCAFIVNIIIGYKGDDIYVYTPDGSETEERVFNINDKGVEYLEVEILETNGHGRYEYEGTKYNNITPGLVVKKGSIYTLYPGGDKLSVHKSGNVLIGKTGSKKVIFSPPYSIAMNAKAAIAAMTE